MFNRESSHCKMLMAPADDNDDTAAAAADAPADAPAADAVDAAAAAAAAAADDDDDNGDATATAAAPDAPDRLVGLVVRRPPREREVPGSNPASAGIFSGSSHTSDFKIGTPVATLPGAWRYRVSTGTGRPGVGIL